MPFAQTPRHPSDMESRSRILDCVQTQPPGAPSSGSLSLFGHLAEHGVGGLVGAEGRSDASLSSEADLARQRWQIRTGNIEAVIRRPGGLARSGRMARCSCSWVCAVVFLRLGVGAALQHCITRTHAFWTTRWSTPAARAANGATVAGSSPRTSLACGRGATPTHICSPSLPIVKPPVCWSHSPRNTLILQCSVCHHRDVHGGNCQS
ncbi:hypothetical protein C8T65DRAFT_270583 [Cerioporus squamosus]|nr:hypothetical protein C8T65DRAFT_270583 [Cerioporus squamosus]